ARAGSGAPPERGWVPNGPDPPGSGRARRRAGTGPHRSRTGGRGPGALPVREPVGAMRAGALRLVVGARRSRERTLIAEAPAVRVVGDRSGGWVGVACGGAAPGGPRTTPDRSPRQLAIRPSR